MPKATACDAPPRQVSPMAGSYLDARRLRDLRLHPTVYEKLEGPPAIAPVRITRGCQASRDYVRIVSSDCGFGRQRESGDGPGARVLHRVAPATIGIRPMVGARRRS